MFGWAKNSEAIAKVDMNVICKRGSSRMEYAGFWKSQKETYLHDVYGNKPKILPPKIHLSALGKGGVKVIHITAKGKKSLGYIL